MIKKLLPMHPGEALREEFLVPLNLSAGTLANINSNSSIGKGDNTSAVTNANSLVLNGGTLNSPCCR